ncbi:MAG: hypothetical protein AAGC43_04715 [Bacteroidota bacterium]
MKSLLFIIIWFSYSALASAQEVRVYFPIRTVHFDQSPEIAYVDNEGGDIGAVGSYRINHKARGFHEFSLGALRNSYGNLSVVALSGYGYRLGQFETSFNLGIASGYSILFSLPIQKLERITPDFMEELGLIPMGNLTMSFNLGKVSPLLVVSPAFINAGFVWRLR